MTAYAVQRACRWIDQIGDVTIVRFRRADSQNQAALSRVGDDWFI